MKKSRANLWVLMAWFACAPYVVAQDNAYIEPKIIHATATTYPAEARRAGLQGSVVVELIVDSLGTASNIKVLSSSGYPELDAAAIEGVKNYEYEPAKRNGKNVEGVKRVKVDFKLNPLTEEELAGQQEPNDPVAAAKKGAAFAIEKFRNNTANAYCGQNVYLKCFNIGYAQCMTELSAIKDECLALAIKRYPEITSREIFENFRKEFLSCVNDKHVVSHAENSSDIAQCENGMQFDEKKYYSDITR